MTALAPSEVVPSIPALLMLPMEDGADPLFIPIQYRVPTVKSFGVVCTLFK